MSLLAFIIFAIVINRSQRTSANINAKSKSFSRSANYTQIHLKIENQ